MTEDTAQQMRWAVEGNRYTDKMIHPSDGTAWKNFVKKFPLKAGDPRSVAVAISTDGFNPYANWMRGLNIETLRVQGLKSHDYHIWLERIMPVMIRGYVPEKTWRVLARLSFSFRQICARELDTNVIEKLDEEAPVLLCDLETIFPPGFFNPMQHMILHLAEECLKGGELGPLAVWSRERNTKASSNDNKCKIEASIAEAVPNVEVANFTTKHYDPNIPTKHNPVLRYNAANNEEVPKLSIFLGLGGKSSGSKPYRTDLQERTLIHSYVLNTMVEVKPYIENPTKRLHGWDVVMTVPSRNRPPPPNKDDYRRVDPSSKSVEFYQEEGLPGHFTIALPTIDDMVVDDEQEDAGMDGDNAEDEAEDVCAPEDLSLLEAFRAGIDLDVDGPPPGFIDDYWFAEPDDDDETRGPITDGDTGY
ncbi:hypothetical protein QYE76_058915 [Lolium multiflorum]|uniref:DUF4218 domain-containing protein n=1 Tax=Lolium multiflorum TaxID=4521 RepID=A0AAD8T6B3_LOLMU|nr:hypothetical protein QYE76_058915 [Lolium multiflorum]